MSRSLNTKQKEEVVISYNKLAMEQLQQDDYESSMSYLKQALIGIKSVLEESLKSKLMAITFNNLGCLFKRTGNFAEALKYLYKSVNLEKSLPTESATIAGAHLNICSILSQQNEHSKAIRHGLRSIFLLKSVYRDQPKHVPTLIIAYHNVGTEYQALGHMEDAEDCLRVGLKISQEYLGPQHNLTTTLRRSLMAVNRRGRSPTFEAYVKATPKTRLPIVSAKSRSHSQESRQSAYKPYLYEVRTATKEKPEKRSENVKTRPYFPASKVEIQRPFVPKMFSDEEVSVKTDKSGESLNSTIRKIDLGQHKATERVAAVMIQSWVRGWRARKRFRESQMEARLKQAELKARKAVEEYEKLKQISIKNKGKGK
jgi:tetratricopeptide (TPR) repeat protein